MWQVEGLETAADFFSKLRPEKVLYDFDGPAIFTSRDIFGGQLLVYLCDEDEELSRFLAVPCQDDDIVRLEEGRAPVRAVLSRSHIWIIDVRHSGVLQRAWLARQGALPEDALPRADVLLMPPSESARRARQYRTPTSRSRRELPRLSLPRQDMASSRGAGP